MQKFLWAALPLLFGGAAGTSIRAAAGTPQGVRQVVLDEKTVGKVFAIRISHGVLTTVEFPDSFLEPPTCSESCDSTKEPDETAPYRLDVQADGRYLTLSPRDGRSRNGDRVATILVRLEHATVTLFLERGERARADTRVVFQYPDRRADNEYLRAERIKLEAETEARVRRGVNERFVRAFSRPHSCFQRTKRSRQDDIVLELLEVCRFENSVIVVFQIENLARPTLQLNEIVLRAGGALVEDKELGDRRLEFQGVRVGAQLLELKKDDSAPLPTRLDLRVSAETDGKAKNVHLEGIEF